MQEAIITNVISKNQKKWLREVPILRGALFGRNDLSFLMTIYCAGKFCTQREWAVVVF